MFRKSVVLASLLAVAFAGPLRRNSGPVTVVSGGSNLPFGSFNGFNGLSSMSNFDSFFGQGNFCGQQNPLQMSGEQVVCQALPMNNIQQQYAVLAEYAKKVLLSHVCQVEAQPIVWGQFMGMLQSFQNDFMHQSERKPTFDCDIAGKITQVCDSNGNINTGDLGFQGHQIGGNCVQIVGLNWNPQTSPISVQQSWGACQSVISSSLSAPLCPVPPPSSCLAPPTVISSPPSSGCSSPDCGMNGSESVVTLSNGQTTELPTQVVGSAGNVVATGSSGSVNTIISPQQASNLVASATMSAGMISPTGMGVMMVN